MHTAEPHRGASRGALTALAALVALALVALLPVGPAGADIEVVDSGDQVPAVRYAGETRYETAALIATDDTPLGADFEPGTVVVATGDRFPDALSASYAAGLTTSPVLLAATDDLTDPTRAALEQLAPERIVVVGGTAAVSEEIATELATYAEVTRVAGVSRTDTAAQVAALGDADGDGALDDGTTTAIVASSAEAPGALAAGPVSYAAGYPLLLTAPDALAPETAAAIDALGITDVIVAGGPDVVANSVVGELVTLGASVRRVGTDNRTEIATGFAQFAVSELGFVSSHVNLATFSDFADALALAAHAGADRLGPAPILLTEADSVGFAAEAYLTDAASCGLLALHVAGGTAAVSDEVLAEARQLVTPADPCTDADRLVDLVGASSVNTHLQAFQAIADANGGNRASGTPGYDASVDYVVEQLTAAGYTPEVQTFDFDLFTEVSPTEVTVDGVQLTEEQALVMEYSGAGDVTGTTELVDADLGPGNPGTGEANDGDSDSGCEPEDFDGFTEGAIALIQRGGCNFAVKALNAAEAGASAVLIFNQGHDEENSVVVAGTLGGPVDEDLPVVGLDTATGLLLADDPALEVRIVTDTTITPETSANVIADTPTGDPDDVVMVGAHLDSVAEGPGINDNGSGSAAILDVALAMADAGIEPTNTVRFAWWGAEENGLVGSNAYVFGDGADLEGISDAEYEAIKLYLNFDMVGSPNYVRFIYDGDGDAFELEGPPGSDAIEESFEDFFDSRDLASAPTEFSGRSDYQAFINVGIPAGGLFTGAEGVKTEEEAELFGGQAGVAYDPCYHAVCDTIENPSLEVVDDMVDAIASVTLQYATSLDGIPERPAPEEGGFAQGQPLHAAVRHDAAHGHAHGYNDTAAS